MAGAGAAPTARAALGETDRRARRASQHVAFTGERKQQPPIKRLPRSRAAGLYFAQKTRLFIA
eukprot:7384657-Prymnesium_polylepis.2